MARSLYLSAALLVLLAMTLPLHCTLALAAGDAAPTYNPTGGEGSLRPEQCAPACDYRCSKTHHRKPCLFFCNKCCKKCLCVPSGTYGNKEECPCYNNWKTKEGGPKCP